MSGKQTYKVISPTNFSIGKSEYYLQAGETVELPDHELIESLLKRGHIEKVEAEKSKPSTPVPAAKEPESAPVIPGIDAETPPQADGASSKKSHRKTK